MKLVKELRYLQPAELQLSPERALQLPSTALTATSGGKVRSSVGFQTLNLLSEPSLSGSVSKAPGDAPGKYTCTLSARFSP